MKLPKDGPIMPASESGAPTVGAIRSQQEMSKMLVRVGKEAPDFEANAFMEGVGFKPVKLSDYKDRWSA